MEYYVRQTYKFVAYREAYVEGHVVKWTMSQHWVRTVDDDV
jgi:hypothetical protein